MMNYREIIPDQTNPQIWKDIALNTGKCVNRIFRLCLIIVIFFLM